MEVLVSCTCDSFELPSFLKGGGEERKEVFHQPLGFFSDSCLVSRGMSKSFQLLKTNLSPHSKWPPSPDALPLMLLPFQFILVTSAIFQFPHLQNSTHCSPNHKEDCKLYITSPSPGYTFEMGQTDTDDKIRKQVWQFPEIASEKRLGFFNGELDPLSQTQNHGTPVGRTRKSKQLNHVWELEGIKYSFYSRRVEYHFCTYKKYVDPKCFKW